MQEVFEKVIEKLERLKTPCELGMIENGRYVLRDKAIEIVKQATKEYNNGWIPCRERMPEKNKPVLCWVTSTTIASGETYIIGSCDNGFWFLQTYEIGHHHFPVKDYKVVAWQPLPEPYHPKGE